MSLEIPHRRSWTDLQIAVAAALTGAVGMLVVTMYKSLLMKVGVLAAALLVSVGVFAYPHLGVALIVLTMPYMNLSPTMQGGPLSSLQPSAILLPLTLLAASAQALITRRYKLTWTALSTPVAALGVALVVLVGFRALFFYPRDELQVMNVKTVGRFVMGTGLFFLITQYVATRERLGLLVAAFAIGAAGATAIGLAQYYFGFKLATTMGVSAYTMMKGGIEILRVTSTLGSPHTFAMLTGLLLLLCFCMALSERQSVRRAFYAAGGLFFLAGLITTQTRAGVLLVVVGAVAVCLRRRYYKMIGALAVGLVAFQLLSFACPQTVGRFGLTETSELGSARLDESGMLRLRVYNEALDYIDGNPIIGSGLIYARLQKPGRPWTAHNCFLDMWIAGGIVLLGLFVWVIYSASREMWHAADPRRHWALTPYATWLLASLAGIAAFMMVDVLESDYYRPLAFYCILGFAGVVARLFRQETKPSIQPEYGS